VARGWVVVCGTVAEGVPGTRILIGCGRVIA